LAKIKVCAHKGQRGGKRKAFLQFSLLGIFFLKSAELEAISFDFVPFLKLEKRAANRRKMAVAVSVSNKHFRLIKNFIGYYN